MGWIPSRVGISAWRTTCDSGDADHGYEVRDLNYRDRVQGAASMRVDMGIVYTCVDLQCVIHCPCSICNDKRGNCKMQCKSEVCEGCNSQCSRHQMKLPRTFHPIRDHFTMVTHGLDGYLYAIPHAGIPTDCIVCTRDMVEHLTLHLVFHMRCRFCRHQMRPYE